MNKTFKIILTLLFTFGIMLSSVSIAYAIQVPKTAIGDGSGVVTGADVQAYFDGLGSPIPQGEYDFSQFSMINGAFNITGNNIAIITNTNTVINGPRDQNAIVSIKNSNNVTFKGFTINGVSDAADIVVQACKNVTIQNNTLNVAANGSANPQSTMGISVNPGPNENISILNNKFSASANPAGRAFFVNENIDGTKLNVIFDGNNFSGHFANTSVSAADLTEFKNNKFDATYYTDTGISFYVWERNTNTKANITNNEFLSDKQEMCIVVDGADANVKDNLFNGKPSNDTCSGGQGLILGVNLKNNATLNGENINDNSYEGLCNGNYYFVKKHSISITKTASTKNPLPGQKVTYTFVITNTGNTALTNVSVSDSKLDAGTLSPASVGTLAQGAKATFTGIMTVPSNAATNSTITNTAYVTINGQITGSLTSETITVGSPAILIPIPPTSTVEVEKPDPFVYEKDVVQQPQVDGISKTSKTYKPSKTKETKSIKDRDKDRDKENKLKCNLSFKDAVITASDITINVGAKFNIMNNVQAIDNGGRGKDITKNVTSKGKINTAVAGKFVIVYEVIGENCNKVSKSITVTVVKP